MLSSPALIWAMILEHTKNGAVENIDSQLGSAEKCQEDCNTSPLQSHSVLGIGREGDFLWRSKRLNPQKRNEEQELEPKQPSMHFNFAWPRCRVFDSGLVVCMPVQRKLTWASSRCVWSAGDPESQLKGCPGRLQLERHLDERMLVDLPLC